MGVWFQIAQKGDGTKVVFIVGKNQNRKIQETMISKILCKSSGSLSSYLFVKYLHFRKTFSGQILNILPVYFHG